MVRSKLSIACVAGGFCEASEASRDKIFGDASEVSGESIGEESEGYPIPSQLTSLTSLKTASYAG